MGRTTRTDRCLRCGNRLPAATGLSGPDRKWCTAYCRGRARDERHPAVWRSREDFLHRGGIPGLRA